MDQIKETLSAIQKFIHLKKEPRQKVKLTPIIDQVLEAETKKHKKKMNIHTHLCKNSEIIVSPESIKQVFEEIINNAAEAIDTSGIISVSSTNENKCMTIYINDTGRGILPEHISRVFEPYQSFNRKKSCGIGLFIARKIIEDHSGTIKLESTYGQGTSVIITLPDASE